MKHKRPLNMMQYFPLAALLLAGCGETEKAASVSPAPEVGVYTVKAQPLTLFTDLPGRTSAYRVAEVRPQVSGILQKRLFTEGSEVKAGQALYQIDPNTYEARLNQALAKLATAEKLMKRYEHLLKSNAVSLQQFDDASATWKEAVAQVRVANINVQFTKVLSPISGRIGRSAVTEGSLVVDGQAQELATVTQLDPIYVDVTQPITKMLGLQRALENGSLQRASKDSAEVALTLDDGSAYSLPGTLKFSEVTVDQNTGAVTLRAQFPNPGGKLLPGMFVHAQLKEGVSEKAILVPQQAIIRDPRGVATAWVVKSDDTVEKRELQTLRTVGNAWLVGVGIDDGDRVISEGTQRVSSGMKVKPTDATNVTLRSKFSPPDVAAVN